jgi:hypothetical protein
VMMVSNKTSKTGVVGVTYDHHTRRLKTWRARIYRTGQRTNLGRFLTKEEAVDARAQAECQVIS